MRFSPDSKKAKKMKAKMQGHEQAREDAHGRNSRHAAYVKANQVAWSKLHTEMQKRKEDGWALISVPLWGEAFFDHLGEEMPEHAQECHITGPDGGMDPIRQYWLKTRQSTGSKGR